MIATQEPYVYEGGELELFQHAHNWKSYFARHLAPFIQGRVLEVGAGIGGTTRFLNRGPIQQWVCLEPDPELANVLPERLSDAPDLAVQPEVVIGTLDDVPAEGQFDTILYIDVLEHIEDDAAELVRAAERLAPGGRVVTLSPAHNFLFTPFDRAVGHHRRYDRGMIRRVTPEGCRLARLRYLDSCGLLASLGNRAVLKSAHPKPSQIRFWDRCLVRASRVCDVLSGYRLGKSIVAIWQRDPR